MILIDMYIDGNDVLTVDDAKKSFWRLNKYSPAQCIIIFIGPKWCERSLNKLKKLKK